VHTTVASLLGILITHWKLWCTAQICTKLAECVHRSDRNL